MRQQIMKTLVAAMLVSGAGAWAAPVHVLQAQDRQTEKRLSDQIEDRFEQDATLKNHNLRASVDGRVATLTGTVETEGQRDRAGRLARVAGISGVENHIVLGPVYKGLSSRSS